MEQERVHVILMYVESLVDPPRFLNAAQRAAELGKPIVMIKIGNSDAGRRAAGSHTGAMVGPASAVNAALAHHGIIRAEDQDELLNIAAAFVHNPLPAGNRVGIVSVSGGTAAWLADACTAAGLEVPQLDAERRARIAGCIPSFGASDNPVDVTAQASDGFVKWLEIVGEAPCIDGVIMAVNFATERRLVKEGRAIADWVRRVGKPVLIYSYAIPSDRSRELLRELRLHCFTSLQGCVRGFRALVDYAASSVRAGKSLRRLRHRATCQELQDTCSIRPRRSSANTRRRLCSRRTACACRARSLARSAEEAVAHARKLGYPVALKIQSPEIAHKTEARGIKLALRDDESVHAAFDEIIANARAYCGQAEIRGVLVQKMAPPGRELIAGIANQSDYGPMVMVGLGGIYAEVLDDKTLAPAPFSHATARDMLGRLRGAGLLNGVRGEPPCDVEAMADFLVRLSRLAWDGRDMLEECDMNPVLVHAAGARITVVDALAIKKS